MQYELTHDKLAAQIYVRASAAAKARRRAQEIYTMYLDIGKQRLFEPEELDYLSQYLAVLSPSDELQELLERSRMLIKERDEAEKMRLEQELAEKQKLYEQAEKQRKRAILASRFGFALAGVSLILLIFALKQTSIAKNAKGKETKALKMARDSSDAARREREIALNTNLELISAKNKSDSLKEESDQNAAIARQGELNTILANANVFRKDHNYVAALAAYDKALKQFPDATDRLRLERELARTKQEKQKHEYDDFRETGRVMMLAKDYQGAMHHFQKAWALRQDQDLELKKWMEECKKEAQSRQK